MGDTYNFEIISLIVVRLKTDGFDSSQHFSRADTSPREAEPVDRFPARRVRRTCSTRPVT